MTQRLSSQSTQVKVSYVSLLPSPLQNLVARTSQRQLVIDIEQSGSYPYSFPVLEKLENFGPLWDNLKEKVSLKYGLSSTYPHFFTKWQIVSHCVDLIDFEGFPLVSREAMRAWPLDFSFMVEDLDEYDQHLLGYLGRILNPSTLNVWQDLVKQSENLLDRYVGQPIDKLQAIRSIEDDSDPEVLKLSAKLVGLNFRDDLLRSLGAEKIRHLIPMVGRFYEVASTDRFISLIELVLSSRALLSHLYSNNYITFKSYSDLTIDQINGLKSIKGQRDWFKTTHVNLYVEYDKVSNLLLQVETSSLIDLIYSFLPLNLVLHNLGLFYEIEEQPSLYISSTISGINSSYYFSTYSVQPLPKPDAVLTALVFDEPVALNSYLTNTVPPTLKEVYQSWGRFSGKLYFDNQSSAVGDATSFSYDERNDRIYSTANSNSLLGLVSQESLDYFHFEALCGSTDSDDDLIGLVAAFVRGPNTNKSLVFYRANTLINNWFLRYQENESIKTLVNRSGALTKGFENPEKNGWKQSGPTVISIERNKSIITARTSSFNSTVVESSTEIKFDLSSDPQTLCFLEPCRYGFAVFSQAQASFNSIKFTGGRTETVYDIANNKSYRYDQTKHEWVSIDHDFSQSAKRSSRYYNPYTNLEFSVDSSGSITRL